MYTPPDQNQHRIPQVYLKEFGYLENQVWKISAFSAETMAIEEHEISSFASYNNLFDMPYETYKETRHYELSFGKIETEYHKICNTVQNQKKLTGRTRDLLNHFLATLIARSEYFELLINDFLNDEKLASTFLDEIMMVEGDKNLEPKFTREYFQFCIHELEDRDKYNSLMGQFINSLVWRLRGFSIVILQSKNAHEWVTSDNPVFIDFNEDASLIITAQSEIYFPLNRKYMLYMWFPDGQIENELQKLKVNKLNSIDDELSLKIATHYIKNPNRRILLNPNHEVYEHLKNTKVNNRYKSLT